MKTLKLLPKNEHWYPSPTKKDVWYPSVTFVTGFLPKGQFFERYLAEQGSYEEAQKILKEAGDRGTRVHEASEELDRGNTVAYETSGLTDEEYQLLSFYVDWHKKYNPQTVHVELRLVSDKHKLGGTSDRIYIIGLIDGKRTLLDLKTSKSAIFDSHWLQVSAYADMYEWLKKEQIDAVAILRLTSKRKDGYEYIVRDRKEWKDDYKQFKRTYDTMIYLNKGKSLTPKIIEVPEILSLK
jgi:hypothetical protein